MANMYRVGGNNGNPTLSGNAATGDVLSGKTFYNNSTQMHAGTMTNNGAVSQSLDCGNSYTIPEGYHNGSGTVSANSLASQTGVDSGKYAVSSDEMLFGCQGWVNGQKVTGTLVPDYVNNTAMSTQLGDRTIYPDPGKFFNSFTVEQFPREYVIPTHILPSDSNPVSIDVGDAVTPDIAGYVYASNTAVVPSGNKSLGTYTTNGSKSASCVGYATVSWTNNVQPTETTLWTNSSPTSNFAAQNVTLNQSIDTNKFTYIAVEYRISTSLSTTGKTLFRTADLIAGSKDSTNALRAAIITRPSNTAYARVIEYVSATQLYFSNGSRIANTSTSSAYTIPTKISGIKF